MEENRDMNVMYIMLYNIHFPSIPNLITYLNPVWGILTDKTL